MRPADLMRRTRDKHLAYVRFAPICVIQSYAKPPPKPVIRSECGLARLLATIRIVAPATAEQNDATRTASLTCARTAPVVDRERPNKKAHRKFDAGRSGNAVKLCL